MQRRFTHAKHQRAALFQHHICGTRHQGVGIAVDDARERFNRARQNHHAGSFKRTGGDAGSDVAGVMHHVGQRLYVAQGEIGFESKGLTRSLAHHQMGLDIRHVAQHFQQTYAVNGTAGTGDPYNELFHDFALSRFRADCAGFCEELQVRAPALTCRRLSLRYASLNFRDRFASARLSHRRCAASRDSRDTADRRL
ncbi:hypothetical protein D3C76_1121270 [compost metagenome]